MGRLKIFSILFFVIMEKFEIFNGAKNYNLKVKFADGTEKEILR